ncbi:hypothetical protein ATK17_2404 [Branchiibius hedensis]|uniref:Luciferase-like monooxygenase n=1 Tax=Branchiibius hedensis TaxID=672460 RepID=A0A2Y8ZXR5_9MICO|nr:hypothetical protein [Branchiibius hedensis]PWJ26257.1 hypothetical protein ATK17_2404 [Branchiibius hedensis]SSA35069.1 hypothetical protein SAMN04489750_2404 [Branchiibius hedensis]
MPIPLILDLGQPRLDPATISDQVHRTEAAGVSIVSFSDAPVLPHPGGLEAGTSAAFVSTRTDRVGLAPQLHVTTTEPLQERGVYRTQYTGRTLREHLQLPPVTTTNERRLSA